MPPPASVSGSDRLAARRSSSAQPDLVIKSPPYTLAPRTQDKWFRPVTETGLTEPRWVRAIEIKPSYPDGRRIVHHVLTTLDAGRGGRHRSRARRRTTCRRTPACSWSGPSARSARSSPPDAGKLMLPGSSIRWEIHMFAIGEEIKDNQVELGVYFYPKGFVPKNRTVLRMFDVEPRLRARHPAERSGDDAELLRHAGAGAASRTSSRTCTCAARRCRWRRSIPTAARKC